MMRNELKPLDAPFSTEVADILGHYPQRDGYLLELFRVFANSVRFLRKGTVNLLDKASPISMREREIVILRVCANNDCEYEWGVHVTAFSAHVKLSKHQVEATRNASPDAGCWTADEQTLIRVVDELCDDGCISDASYEKFQTIWNLEQQLEIFALCGNYHTISFIANSTRIPGESFGAKFPG